MDLAPMADSFYGKTQHTYATECITYLAFLVFGGHNFARFEHSPERSRSWKVMDSQFHARLWLRTQPSRSMDYIAWMTYGSLEVGTVRRSNVAPHLKFSPTDVSLCC